MTSYFGKLKMIRPPLVPIAITRSVPDWFAGSVDQRLAPTRAMLRLPADEFNAAFAALLADLDPAALYEELNGETAVLLCFEKPGEPCHRRIVAEWFERSLGIEVPELFVPPPTPSLFDNL